MFKKHAKLIDDDIGRLVDLEKIINDCCMTHANFYGGTSTQVALSALVP